MFVNAPEHVLAVLNRILDAMNEAAVVYVLVFHATVKQGPDKSGFCVLYLPLFMGLYRRHDLCISFCDHVVCDIRSQQIVYHFKLHVEGFLFL